VLISLALPVEAGNAPHQQQREKTMNIEKSGLEVIAFATLEVCRAFSDVHAKR